MSEYQCYEFVAHDRPLTAKQMAELRRISTRAQISPTRFWNEYHWGDLKADPAKLIERYFGAHLYFANWGTNRLMFRIPKTRVDAKALKRYFVGGRSARLGNVGDHILLDFTSDTEEPEYDEESQGSLAALSPVRAELMRGDLRSAYLAWLLAVQNDDVDQNAVEPDVPAGLGELTAAQEAMVQFLRIDVDLVAAAATGSAEVVDDLEPFRRWVAGLSADTKDAWLRRAAEQPDLALGGELLRAFHLAAGARPSEERRTVAELRALAEQKRADRQEEEAARARKAEQAAAQKRQRRLAKLARDVDAAWRKLEKLVASNAYDEAVRLAVDLRDLALATGSGAAFTNRFDALRKRQAWRRGFLDRWRLATQAPEASQSW
jgi:hypothetical protein